MGKLLFCAIVSIIFSSLVFSSPASAACITGTTTSTDTYTYVVTTSTYSTCDNNTLTTPSTVAVAPTVLKAATSQVTNLVANRISALTFGSPRQVNMAPRGANANFYVSPNGRKVVTGISGGDKDKKYGAWLSGTFSAIEESSPATAFDGSVYAVLGGIDYVVDDGLSVVGIAVGVDNLDLDTLFNSHPTSGIAGTLEGEGFTFAPYASTKINKNLSAQIMAGWSSVDYDSTRYDQTTGSLITGTSEASRSFFQADVVGQKTFSNNWYTRGNAGWIYATERIDSFTESNGNLNPATDSHISQFRFGGELGLMFGGFSPYVKTGIEYDYSKTDTIVAVGQVEPADDDFGVNVGGGMRYSLPGSIDAGIEGNATLLRDNFKERSVTGNVRVKF